MTTTKQYIEQAMTAMLNDDTDRAIGLLMRASLAYDDSIAASFSDGAQQMLDKKSIIHAGPPGTRDLPPMQPLKDKPTFDFPKFVPETGVVRIDSPSHVACPVCKAPKGRICLGVMGDTVGKPLAGKGAGTGWHAERRSLWKSKRRELSHA